MDVIDCSPTGYILAVIFIDRIGRKRLQLFGFAGEAIIFGYMAHDQVRVGGVGPWVHAYPRIGD